MKSRTSPSNRADIYARVSSKAQEDGYSLETQIEACRKYAVQNNYNIRRIWQEVYTGVELWDRPQLSLLREAIRRKETNILIAYQIDRLSRDAVHLGVIISEAEHVGARVEFVCEPLEHTPEGELIRFVRGYAAKIEHEKIKERTLRGRRARVDAGKALRGYKDLYGYIWDRENEIYVPAVDTAPVVVRIYESIIAGYSTRSIAERLTIEGVKTPSGRAESWQAYSISQIVRNPAYAGNPYAYRRKNVNNKKTQRIRDASEWIKLPSIPALVTLEMWQVAQVILDRNADHWGRKHVHVDSHLLAGGIAVCGYCGGHMYSGRRSNGKPLYICGNHKNHSNLCRLSGHISAERLDREVWQAVCDFLHKRKDYIDKIASLQQTNDTNANIETINRQIATIEKRRATFLNRLIDMELDDTLVAQVKANIKTLTDEKKQLETEREILLANKMSEQAIAQDLQELELWLDSISRDKEDVPFDEKRVALKRLRVRVRVYRADRKPLAWDIEIGISVGNETTSKCKNWHLDDVFRVRIG